MVCVTVCSVLWWFEWFVSLSVVFCGGLSGLLAACVVADLWRHGHGGVPPLPVVNQVSDL